MDDRVLHLMASAWQAGVLELTVWRLDGVKHLLPLKDGSLRLTDRAGGCVHVEVIRGHPGLAGAAGTIEVLYAREFYRDSTDHSDGGRMAWNLLEQAKSSRSTPGHVVEAMRRELNLGIQRATATASK